MFMQTTTFITVRARRPLTDIEFCASVARAVPGDGLEYHRGFLVLDAFPVFSPLPEQQRADLVRLESRAFRAAEQGLVHLVQERTGPDQFAYIAVARPKLKAATARLNVVSAEAPPGSAVTSGTAAISTGRNRAASDAGRSPLRHISPRHW